MSPTTNNSGNSHGAVEPFASAAALKAVHADLLKRYREALGGRSVHEDNSPRLQALLPDVKSFIERGRVTGALIDAEDERMASQQFLDHWGSVIYRTGLYQDEGAQYDATLVEFDPELSPALDDSRCPYIGLDAFQEQNHENFFGRKPLVEEMLKILKEGRLLAVVGPSGSGKSSVVLAGLLPKLKAGALPESQKWSYYPPIIPGANPLRTLALALRPANSGTPAWVEQQVEAFLKDDKHLLKLVEEAGDLPGVIVVDQFEEVFTLCNDEAQLQSFVSNLLALMKSTRGHRVIITMRIDFEEQMPRLEAFYQSFRQGRVQVMPLSAADLRDAIERPAESVGLKFEKGIVDKLVKEIVGEPAGLPLLQFTLLELWKRRWRDRVTWEDYNALGGTRQALTKSADKFYNNLLPEDQVVAKRILLRLAWAGEGVEILRNRVRREELHKVGGSSDKVNKVLGELVVARLIRLTRDEMAAGAEESPDDQFEVAHEALIRNWLKLVQWLQEERDTLRHRIRLRSAAEQWKAYGRDPGGLLGGALLEEAMAYEDLNELEAEFVSASKRAAEEAEREKQEAYRREVEQVKELAAERQQRIEAQSRAARRLWALVALLTISLLAAGGFAIYASSQAKEAKVQRDEATKQTEVATRQTDLAKASESLAREKEQLARDEQKRATAAAEDATLQRGKAEEERKRALALAEEARRAKQDADAARALAIQRADEHKQTAEKLKLANIDLERQRGAIQVERDIAEHAREEAEAAREAAERSSEVAENARLKAENASAEAKKERDAAVDAQLEAKKKADESGKLVYALLAQTTFSPDGKKILAVTKDAKSVRVWDASSKELIKEIATKDSAIPAISRDGKFIATTNTENEVQLLDVSTGQKPQQFGKVSFTPVRLELSPDASRLAIIGDEGELKVIDLKTGKPTASLSSKGAQIVDVAFSPDGQTIATTDIAQENTLIKVGPNQSIETSLKTGKCTPLELKVLELSPSYDLKASFAVEKTCTADEKSIWKFVMDIYSRKGEGFEQISHVSYRSEGEASEETLTSLATEGLQGKQADFIGQRLKEFGKQAAEITDVDGSTRMSKLNKLSVPLFWSIVDDLGLPRPSVTN